MRMLPRLISVVTVLVLLPAAAYAQASIAGVVKDASGAVLPGVTVEAASSALIEKTRSVVTDGTGQYKIVDLRPGTYTVTFTLPGFNTFRRDGIELTGSFTATVNVELKVGAVEESITVTGETPIVDLQSTPKERVLAKDVIEALPTGRLISQLGVLVPGIAATSNQGAMTGTFQDVGGSAGDGMTNLVVHGSRADSGRTTMNGINISAISGYMGGRSHNMGAVQELALDTAGVSAEFGQGGPRTNLIPREGGNSFRGTFFGSFANHTLAGSNLTQDLIDRGLPVPNSVYKIWDVNPGFGGPILKDRIWFYTTVRHFGTDRQAAIAPAPSSACGTMTTGPTSTATPTVARRCFLMALPRAA